MRWKTNRRTRRRYPEGFLDVAPTHVRGGHTLSEHFGRKRIEEDPHSFARLLVSNKRKKLGLRNIEQHKKKHKRQLEAELRARKTHNDFKPITAQLEDDEITSFF